MKNPNVPFLLTPGPVTLSDEVSSALAQPMLFHRAAGFRKLYASVRHKLLLTFGATSSHEALVLSGSGTLGNEAVLSSVFGRDDNILVLANGEFGERLGHIMDVHAIGHTCLFRPWACSFDLSEVDTALSDPSITGVAMVAMETSTGMVNPVSEIGQRCRVTNRMFFVDAISALGAEKLDVERDNIDFCVGVPNKGLEGPPGLALVCARRSTLESRRGSSSKSIYMDLYRYLDFAKNNQTPSTPAVPLMAGLEKALIGYLREGSQSRRERYQLLSKLLLDGVKDLGIFPLLPHDVNRAVAVTALVLPAHVSAEDLHNFLLEKGITVWKPVNLGPFAHLNIIQVSVMGAIGQEEIEYFLDLLATYLKGTRATHNSVREVGAQ
jgi:2-aminoethylphosphonate-pyruvate transaminase